VKIFNYLESPANTTYNYNHNNVDIECDIIVIDNGINGYHQEFIIEGQIFAK